MVPAKRSPTEPSHTRRVRRRIVPSSSDDDDEENEQKNRSPDASADAVHESARHKDGDGNGDNKEGNESRRVASVDTEGHRQKQQRQHHTRPIRDDLMDDDKGRKRQEGMRQDDDCPLDDPVSCAAMCRETTMAAPEQAARSHTDPAMDEDAFTPEIHYNSTLVDEMAARATTDHALCVWNRRAGLWRLVLAARPGSDRRRPWRIVADHRMGSQQPPTLSSGAQTDVRWIEWSSVRSLAVDLLTTSAHTVLAVDADCEPPGDDPEAKAVTVASSWLFAVCRAWASGQWPSRDVAVPALALRMAEVAAADPDGPHATEAIAIAQACVQRLRERTLYAPST